MQIFYKILILGIVSLLGWLMLPLMINILILLEIIQAEAMEQNFVTEMTQKAVFIWLVGIVLGIVSLFIKQKWRYILLACPLIGPSLFAIIYSL